MATEYALERDEKAPIGSFDSVQSLIREVFPTVEFQWTQSGPDKLALAAERGIEFPPELREALKTLPSLLEGRFATDEALVEFGLGFQEPVRCLYVTPRGSSATLNQQLSKLEAKVGGKFVVSGEETNRLDNPGSS